MAEKWWKQAAVLWIDMESRRELFECCAEVLMECKCGRLILLEVVGYS